MAYNAGFVVVGVILLADDAPITKRGLKRNRKTKLPEWDGDGIRFNIVKLVPS